MLYILGRKKLFRSKTAGSPRLPEDPHHLFHEFLLRDYRTRGRKTVFSCNLLYAEVRLDQRFRISEFGISLIIIKYTTTIPDLEHRCIRFHHRAACSAGPGVRRAVPARPTLRPRYRDSRLLCPSPLRYSLRRAAG